MVPLENVRLLRLSKSKRSDTMQHVKDDNKQRLIKKRI